MWFKSLEPTIYCTLTITPLMWFKSLEPTIYCTLTITIVGSRLLNHISGVIVSVQ
jgi:hypothetical protein